MPAVCEEKSLSYCYTPSRQDLGTAMGVKRGCLMVMVREHEDYKELYQEMLSEVNCGLAEVPAHGASVDAVAREFFLTSRRTPVRYPK